MRKNSSRERSDSEVTGVGRLYQLKVWISDQS